MSRRGYGPAGAVTAAIGITVLVTVAVSVLVGTDRTAPDDPPPGTAIGAEDRRALGAVPVQRGRAAEPVDPAVDPTDPEAVARAYLAAAYSTGSDDAGRTRLQGAGYAVQGSPPETVGVLVLDPPPTGTIRTATVTALRLLATSADDRRRGYRAELGIATGPPGGEESITLVTRDVVLDHDPDGRWLVAADTTANADLTSGPDCCTDAVPR